MRINQVLRKFSTFMFVSVLFIMTFESDISAATTLPAEVFYKLPALQDPVLSPDGTHLLALKNTGGFTAVMVLNLATGEKFYPTKTDNIEFTFGWVRWANNDKILLSLEFGKTLNGLDNVVRSTRLLAMDAKSESKMIAMVQPKDRRGRFSTFIQDSIVGIPDPKSDSILMAIGEDDYRGNPGVYRVYLASGKRKLVRKADITITRWLADMEGNVRAGGGVDDSTERFVIKILDPKTNEWVVGWSYKQVEEASIVPLGFGGNANDFYLLADYKGRKAVYKADLMAEGFPLTVVLSDEKNDIWGNLVYSNKVKDAVGVSYKSGGEIHTLFWNEDLKKLQSGLVKAMPNAQISIASISDDLRKYIVFTRDAENPGSFLYGNRDTKELLPVADTYPELTADVMVKKQYLSFKGRDGNELSGYLSRPKNTSKLTPVIILPPSAYKFNENGQFDIFSAFFVNRGYTVYQPNIADVRKTSGSFNLYSIGRQGLDLQHDIDDAVSHLINSKMAIADKICIFGKNYGGFAAIMGAVTTPDVYKCAISFAGISDFGKILGSRSYWGHKDTMKNIMGNEKDQLINAMPINSVEKIKIPILLIHGTDDSDVRVQQSRVLADELKRLNKNYEYIELENGNHDLEYLPHRKKVFEAIEIFLKKYLPVE